MNLRKKLPLHYIHKEFPKSCERDDFWGQVKRTVNGKAVSDEQIQMIVETIHSGLKLDNSDTLLDLCCGNGALTDLLFKFCGKGVGVDFSDYLIEVAKSYFERPPERLYILSEVIEFLRSTDEPHKFTKILCYGAFQYLEHAKAIEFLQLCLTRFPLVSIIYIGNLPDKEQIFSFYSKDVYFPGVEHESDSLIGIWRTRDEFKSLAEASGWHVKFLTMQARFYASHYRYDAVLTRFDNSLSHDVKY